MTSIYFTFEGLDYEARGKIHAPETDVGIMGPSMDPCMLYLDDQLCSDELAERALDSAAFFAALDDAFYQPDEDLPC